MTDRRFSHLLHGTILFTFHTIVIKRYALKQRHHPKDSLQLFDFGCLSQKFATRLRVVKVNVTYFLECKEHVEQSFFFHLLPLLKFSVLYIFNNKQVSDTSGSKKLQKYATFGVEFDILRRRHAGMHHSAVCLQ